jgi:hypothetical protein
MFQVGSLVVDMDACCFDIYSQPHTTTIHGPSVSTPNSRNHVFGYRLLCISARICSVGPDDARLDNPCFENKVQISSGKPI